MFTSTPISQTEKHAPEKCLPNSERSERYGPVKMLKVSFS
jgi:hypothetical protein